MLCFVKLLFENMIASKSIFSMVSDCIEVIMTLFAPVLSCSTISNRTPVIQGQQKNN